MSTPSTGEGESQSSSLPTKKAKLPSERRVDYVMSSVKDETAVKERTGGRVVNKAGYRVCS